MPPGPHSSKKSFTIIEVVVAVALFAIIVVPTVGLMSLATRKVEHRFGFGEASELKRRIDNEVRLSGRAFEVDFPTSDEDMLYASRDLSMVGFEGDPDLLDSVKYYRVSLLQPEGYVFEVGDAYRPFVYELIWPAYVESSDGTYIPNGANPSTIERLFMTSVLRR